MTAGFRVWPDPPVYLKHHAVANICHFKGATLQNIHINTPVTLTHTVVSHFSHHQSEGTAPIHSLNWYCSLWHTPVWGNVSITTFFWSQTCGRRSLALPLCVIRAAAGGRAMKMMMMNPYNRFESCLPEQLTCRFDGDENRYHQVKAVCSYTWTWSRESERVM